jgi:hypothetical protein
MVQVINYSEKAIAVIGDTKEIKEQLKGLGGRFNFRLNCGAGWIFPKTKEDSVMKLINSKTGVEHPSVYVGTYRKYNDGSLDGAWIDLVKCGSYDGFLAKCKEVHKNEPDPEYMIQDSENMPDGLDCGEWIDKNEFDDILDAYSGRLAPVKSETNKFSDCLNEFCKGKDEYDKNYYLRRYIGAVKTSVGFLLIEKPKIENSFCFSDEGEEYEYYKSLRADDKKMERHFLNKNLEQFNNLIDAIKDKKEIIYYLCENDNIRLCLHSHYRHGSFENKQLSKEDCEIVLRALEYGKGEFEKRLNTYLKKYGTSKLHTWSYWANA